LRSFELQLRVPSTTDVAGTEYRWDAPGMRVSHTTVKSCPVGDPEGHSGSL